MTGRDAGASVIRLSVQETCSSKKHAPTRNVFQSNVFQSNVFIQSNM
jgi:hypothetical protein